MDSHSFIAPARVKTLLVPVGNISSSQFQKCVETIRLAMEVRLVDVTGTVSRVFNPQSFPQGRVFYDFQTSVDGSEFLFLQDFEPYRKTFVVIGVSMGDVTSDDLAQLKKLYKSVLVHTAIVFEEGSISDNEKVFNHPQTNIETIMCEITKFFLQELTEYHGSYQHLTLRSPGSVGENDPAKFITKQKKKLSSGTALSLSLSDPSSNKISLSSSNERRQSRVKGRQLKILGNLYLLAGNYHAALQQFNESIVLLRSSYDNLWLGSALEGIAISVLLHSYVESSFELAPVISKLLKQQQSAANLIAPATSHTPITSPRSSVSSFMAGNVESLSNIPANDLIYQLMNKVLESYEKSKNEIEDYVPNLVYCDTLVRFLKYMTVLNLNSGELIPQVYDNILKGKTLKPVKSMLDSSSNFERSNILRISNKLFQIDFKRLNILSQIKIYSSLSSVFQDLAYVRKSAFLMRTLLLTLIPEIKKQEFSPSSNDLKALINLLLTTYGTVEDPVNSGTSWVKLHKSVIQSCSLISDKIKDFPTSLLLKSLLLTKFLNSLTDNEQTTILKDIQALLSEHPDLSVNYFDPFIIRGIKLNNLSNPPKKELKVKEVTKKSNDPFIYNPYANKNVVADNPLLVQGETSELILTIQNPFAFQLEINDIKIPTLEILKRKINIPPKKIQNITIPFKPLKTGTIDIQSINLKLNCCQPQDFKIADSLKSPKLNKLKNQHKAYSESVISDYQKDISQNDIDQKADLESVKFDVINSQPTLQLSSKLDTIILLEGGKTQISLKLKNSSGVQINNIRFSVQDSTEVPLKVALEDKTLSMNDINEIEYFLIKESIVILNQIEKIDPLEEVELKLEVLGKRGLNKIDLSVEYGHTMEDSDSFYLRNLDVPLITSVTNCIELASYDIVPLSYSKSSYPSFENWNPEADQDYVLFILDLRNIWNKSIKIDVQLFDYKSSGIVVPMETKRLVLPIKRFKIGKVRESANVPSLLKKKYILPSVLKSEDKFLKQIFWYRQEILDNLKGSWSTESEVGDIEFRGIRISQKNLNYLIIDDILIEFELVDIKYNKAGACHCIKTDDFFTVNVKVINNSDREIKGVLRTIPLSLTYGSVDKRLIYNGTTQRIISKPIKVGESQNFQIGAVVLETGDYEFGAVFDEYGSDEQFVSRSPLRIKAT